MKRPMLLSGITVTVICALLSLYPQSAAVLCATGALVFVLSLIIKKSGKDTTLPIALSLCVFLSSLSFFLFTITRVNPCLKLHNTTTSVQGKIVSSPKIVDGFYRFTIKTDKIGQNNAKHFITVNYPYSESSPLELYDYIHLGDTYLSVPEDEQNNFYTADIADGILLSAIPERIIHLKSSSKTPYYYCLKFKETLINRINTSMSDGNGGLLSGMLFGEKAGIEYDTVKAFRNSGIAHLLAVSGLHTALWCGLLLSILKLFNARDKIGAFACIIFLVAFCTVSAFTPSVIRSSLMTSCALLAPLFKRRADSFNSLGLAVTIILLFNPYTVCSISFQLSAAATAGVLAASSCTERIYGLCKGIPGKRFKALCIYILSSITVSAFSGLFTLPVSAYHFGVISLLAPVANILCVKPAFYGLLTGTSATLLSLISTVVPKNIAFPLYDITEFILNLVSVISKHISDISICTLPVHKTWLVNGLVAGFAVFMVGALIYKLTSKKLIIKFTAILMVLCVFICIFVPLAPTKYKNTLTVVSSGNNICIVLRSGTHYAFITNSTVEIPSDTHDYLPKATSETFDYYIATYLNKTNLYTLEAMENRYHPKETRITKAIHTLCNTQNVSPPPNTFIETRGEYALSSEITFEIIDTYPVQYAIIRGKEKTVYVHLYGDTRLSDVTDTSAADAFVFNGAVPDIIQPNLDTIIISGESSLINDKNASYLQQQCKSLYFTARNGNVQITI